MMIPKTKIGQYSIIVRYSEEDEDILAMRCFVDKHKEEYESFRQGFISGIEWTKKNGLKKRYRKNEKNRPRQIEVNGLLWDTENLVIDGKTHFTYEEALEAAKSVGKRLPTDEEFEELLKLGYRFSKSDKGLYVADNKLFFPAAGYLNRSSGSLGDSGSGGCVWSSSPDGTSNAYGLRFYASDAFVSNYGRTGGFSVRCVQDAK